MSLRYQVAQNPRQARLAAGSHVDENWREPFAALAPENGFTPEDIDEAAAELTELINAIDSAVLDLMDSVRLESDAIAVPTSELAREDASRFRDAFHEQHSQVELARSAPAHVKLSDDIVVSVAVRLRIREFVNGLGSAAPHQRPAA